MICSNCREMLGRPCGQVIVTSDCDICGDPLCGNSISPTYCKKCSKEYEICEYCGKKLNKNG